MTTKTTFLSILLGILFSSASAQELIIRPSIGWGTYNMKDLKNLVEASEQSYPVSVKTTDNFPPYINFKLDVLTPVGKHFRVGISSGYQSTGARNHYADYSGYVKEDFTTQAVNIGAIIGYTQAFNDKFSLNLELMGGSKFSCFEYDGELTIYEVDDSAGAYKFNANSVWFEPQILLERTIASRFSLFVSAAYEFDFGGKLAYKDSPSDYLQAVDGGVARIDWTGMRLGLGVSYQLH